MKTFTSIARPVKPRIRVRTWQRSRLVSAARAGGGGWRPPMSLIFRRPAPPAKSERVIVRLPAAPAPPAAALTQVTHTHQHSSSSFHQYVQPLPRPSVHVHAPAAPATSITGRTRPATMMVPPGPRLRLRAPVRDRPVISGRRPRVIAPSEVQPIETFSGRLSHLAEVPAESWARQEIALPTTRFVIRPRRFDLANRLEQSEVRSDPGRPTPLVHRLQRRVPDSGETKAEETPTAGLSIRRASPIVWRRVQPVAKPDAEVQPIAGGPGSARTAVVARSDSLAPATTTSAPAVAAPPSRPVAFEGPALDRLAEDVMQRIDRRLRIERERRGM